MLETLTEASQAVVVCGILEDAQGRVFLARRGADQALAGYWEFPGGKAEAGESLEAALCREFREELSMGLRVGEEIGRTPIPGNGGLELVALRAWTEDENPVLSVHDRWCWVSPSEAQGLELAPADIPLLEAFIAARSE
ncbi:NUDIX hydrolase [Thioalkalivibrio sp. K90mix]|nr:NUDIX hydrolase [Thioalkalivibrio sp. K90mix]